MGVVIFFLLPLIVSQILSGGLAADVLQHEIKVHCQSKSGTTDDTFVCATLDWWPPTKCNYDMCPWGNAGLFNLVGFEQPNTCKCIKAFSPLRIRIGGSAQDQLVYKVGASKIKKCPHLKKSAKGLFGFSTGCLNVERWDAINNLIQKTGATATFGLNALIGRKKVSRDGLFAGDWHEQNTRDLIEYTHSKGYNIEGWEFGNELCGSGVEAKVEANQYAKDAINLRKTIDEVYGDSKSKPKLLAPGGFYDEHWYKTFLQASGPDVVDVVTHHLYPLGAGNDPSLFTRMQDPLFLAGTAQTYKDVYGIVKSYPWTSAWVSESGGAFNSGGRLVSNSFINSFWYIDTLGTAARFGHKSFCRQTLIGGNYGLLNTTTFVPNPDYYGALLWHRLMGNRVLSVTNKRSPYMIAFAHCSKQEGGGITVAMINMDKAVTFEVSVKTDLNLHPGGEQREEYHLTPKDGDLLSKVVLLNGVPLELTPTLDIPPMNPVLVNPSSSIQAAPHSIVFAVFKNLKAPACA